MPVENIRRIEDITVKDLRHRDRRDPSVAAIVEPDGSTYGIPIYGPHPLHYLWDHLDRGQFRPVRIEEDLVYWVKPDDGPSNPAAMALLGEAANGSIIVTPKRLNFGLVFGSLGL